MNQDETRRSRLERIDRAVARDLEERRRLSWIYWILLALALGVGAWSLLKNPSEAEMFAGSPTVVATVAEQVASSKEVHEQLAANDDLHREISSNEGLRRQLVKGVVSSPELGRQVRTMVRGEMETPLRDGPEPGTGDLSRLQHRISALEARLDDLGREQRLGYELSNRLREVGRELEAIRQDLSQAQRQARDADELLAGELREELRQAEERVVKSIQPASMSYVLKTNRKRELARPRGYWVTVGTVRDGGVRGVSISDDMRDVSISDADRRVFPPPDGAATADLPLGEPFTFKDREGREYEAVFNYLLNRWLANDYVGLEVRTASPD